MTDKQQSALLEKFINNSPIAKHIKVEVDVNHKSFKPREKGSPAHYEDANLLASLLMGAECLCYFLRRNGYKIVKTTRKVSHN